MIRVEVASAEQHLYMVACQGLMGPMTGFLVSLEVRRDTDLGYSQVCPSQ